MIQGIVDAIVAALRTAFPQVADVFTEQVKQGLVEPCFVVCCVNPANQLFVGITYRRNHVFSVQYFPASRTDARAECYAVCEALYQVLEVIGPEGDRIRGTGMSGEVVDGVLVFTVNYNGFVRKERTHDLMEELDAENLEAR